MKILLMVSLLVPACFVQCSSHLPGKIHFTSHNCESSTAGMFWNSLQHLQDTMTGSIKEDECELYIHLGTDDWQKTFNIVERQLLLPGNLPITLVGDTNTVYESAHQRSVYFEGFIEDEHLSLKIWNSSAGVLQMELVIVSDTVCYEMQTAPVPTDNATVGIFFEELSINSINSSSSTGLPLPINVHQQVKTLERHKRSTETEEEKYVELYLIHDYSMYTEFGRNIQTNIDRSIDVVNIMDTVYRSLNTRIALVGIEVWISSNKIKHSFHGSTFLANSIEYSKALLGKSNIDNVQILTAREFDALGIAYVSGMCTSMHSLGISYDKRNKHYALTAATMVHEIGHNLGMQHDSGECDCPTGWSTCFMYAKQGSIVPRYLSKCSAQQYLSFLGKGFGSCLMNKPNISHRKENVCGNNVLEAGEECDCGHPYFCTNPCCNPLTCKYGPNTECENGACCHMCHFKPQFTVCSRAIDECDLDDYCSGDSAECPNMYRPDGLECDIDEHVSGRCFHGMCTSRQSQCNRLWGRHAYDGGEMCFEGLNIRGRVYGHCGQPDIEKEVYTACKKEDAKCGLLQCLLDGPDESGKSKKIMNVATVANGTDYFRCYSGSVTSDINKSGMVADGTPCGEDKYCINQTCTTWYPRSNTSICYVNCSTHGNCSNLGTCHCEVGWEGERCENKTSKILRSDLYLLYHNSEGTLHEDHIYNHILLQLFMTIVIAARVIFKEY